MATFTGLDEVWLVVSPHNPLKEKDSLIHSRDRLEMVRLAVDATENLRVSDVEFQLPQPSYTVDTLTHLSAKYPEHEFSLIMGSDNLASLPKWKNYEILLRDYRFLVYPRRGSEVPELASHPSVSMTETPIMELSATFIRQAIKNKKSVRFFVPESVIEFIESKSLYS